MTLESPNSDDGIIVYSDLDKLAQIGSDGQVISNGDAAIIGGASEAMGQLIKRGSGNSVLKLALQSGDVINKIATITYEFIYDAEGTVSGINVLDQNDVWQAISVDVFNSLIDTAAQYTISAALVAAAPFLAFAGGPIIGATVIAAGVSYVYPYISGYTEDAFNSLLYGTGKVDMQFTNQSGEHNSGLFFKDGMGSLSDKGAVIHFLENSDEDVTGGSFTFSEFGFDRSYKIYDGSVFQTIADNLGITLNEFLSAGVDGSNNIHNYIANYNKVILSQIDDVYGQDNAYTYIPIVINGEAQNIAIELIKVGDEVVLGDESLAVDNNPKVLTLGIDEDFAMVIHSYNQGIDGGDIIIGTDGTNNINYRTDGSDTIIAMGGNDIINAGYGNNIIDGGDGSDTIDYSFLDVGSRDIIVNLENNTATNEYPRLNNNNGVRPVV